MQVDDPRSARTFNWTPRTCAVVGLEQDFNESSSENLSITSRLYVYELS